MPPQRDSRSFADDLAELEAPAPTSSPGSFAADLAEVEAAPAPEPPGFFQRALSAVTTPLVDRFLPAEQTEFLRSAGQMQIPGVPFSPTVNTLLESSSPANLFAATPPGAMGLIPRMAGALAPKAAAVAAPAARAQRLLPARATTPRPMGAPVDLGQQVGQAVRGTDPLLPLGRQALPGPVVHGPIGPRVAPARLGRAADEVRAVPPASAPQPLGPLRLTKTTGKFVRELPEAEQAAVMATRERFINDLAQAGITPTPTLLHRFDKLGNTYARVQKNVLELSQLVGRKRVGIEGKTIEGAGFEAWNEISRNLGKQLGNAQRLIKAGKVKSEETLLKAMDRALDEAGGAATQLLTRVATATGGGLAGASQGETPTEKVQLGAGGALLGALLPSALRKAPQLARAVARKAKPESPSDVLYTSYLLNPSTWLNANLGGVGGTVVRSAEAGLENVIQFGLDKITRGMTSLDPREVIQASKLFKEMLNPTTIREAFQTVLNPRKSRMVLLGKMGEAPRGGWTEATATRFMAPGDHFAMTVMTKAGIPIEEARNVTLTGMPQTKLARDWSKALSTSPERTMLGNLSRTLTIPFPNVGLNMAEQGLQRVPGLNLAPAIRRGAPLARQLAKGASGTASFGAGYGLEGDLPVSAQPAVAAGMGPNALPYMGGVLASLAERRGGDVLSGALQALENLPLMGQAGINPYNPIGSLSRKVVPGAVGFAARYRDPAFGRETGKEALEEAGRSPQLRHIAPGLANIPGLRETLPEKPTPVDIRGEPRVTQSQLGKAFAPAREAFIPPAFDVTDPRNAPLVERGLTFDAPTGTVSFGGFDLPIRPKTRAQIQKAQGAARAQAIDQIATDPQVRAMKKTPANNKVIKDAITQRAQAILGMEAYAIILREEPDAMQRLQQQITTEQP